MHRAISLIGTVTTLSGLVLSGLVLPGLAPVAVAQSSEFGSSDDLQGLQEKSIQTIDPRIYSESPSSIANSPTADDQTRLQLDRNLELIIRPERGTSPVGVYPTDNTSAGNQFQLRYQLEP
ncbi:hypothetical protein J5X98_22620 [Leptothermofonsia sichuanensis E412]|jgi:hypothetical protein|uniref:DUF2730 domain-containing protein n=1 Tax=Leptothermofonsia sichuanensis TaxID=2917832 RepID=UPI001CA6115E|nr:DUF2730 domain-containing protein [Leptothermofonsia sichuanensis]QZZ20052.1 hypothetical protein J5X98_22620 [Leptothermofonsia sichuanensis E412]